MNMANAQRIEANRCKRMMHEKLHEQQSLRGSIGVLGETESQRPASNEEKGLKLLQRIFKRHLRRNFDYIQMGSIDYKRSLMLKQQKEAFQKTRAVEQLANRLHVHHVVAKTKAFCRWREAVKELSHTFNSRESSSANHQLSTVQELISQMNQIQAARSKAGSSDEKLLPGHLSKLSKRKKSALLLMDQLVLARMSDYFSCWKLKVLLSKGQHSLLNLDQSMGQAECSLDYSVFRKYL